MKQIMLTLALLCAAPTATAQTTTPMSTTQAVQRWEYATITQLTTTGFYVLRLPDRAYSGASMNIVAEQLLGRPIRSDEAPVYVVPQHLGELGWELIGVSAAGTSTYYWFKRPKT